MPASLKDEDETPPVAYEDPEKKQSVPCTTEMVDTKPAVLSNVKDESEACPIEHDYEDSDIKRSLNINTVVADIKPTILPNIEEKQEDCSVDGQDSEMKGSTNNPVVMADTTPATLSNIKEEAEVCPIEHDYEDCEIKRSLNIIPVMADIKPPTEPNKEKPDDCSLASKDSEKKGSTNNPVGAAQVTSAGPSEREQKPTAAVSQDLKMTTVSKPRQTKFTESELQVLAEGVVSAYERLFGRLVSSTSVHMKKLLWQRITDKINTVAPVVRNVIEVKKRWNDLKRKIREMLRNHHEACMATSGGPPPVLIMRPWEELTHSVIDEASILGLDGMETGMADNFSDDANAATSRPKHAKKNRKRKAEEKSQMETTSHSLSVASNSSGDIERPELGSTRSSQVICGEVVVDPQTDPSSVQVPNPLLLSFVNSQNSTSQETSEVINLTFEISPSTSDFCEISDTNDQDKLQNQLDHLEVINSTLLEGDNCIGSEALTTVNDHCNMDIDQSHEDCHSNFINKADTAVQTNVTGNIQSINTVISSRLSTIDYQQQTIIENTIQLTEHVKSIDESLKLLVRGQARSQISFNRSMNRLSTSLIQLTKQISNGVTLVSQALTQPPRDGNIQTVISSNVLGQMEEVNNPTSNKDETVLVRKSKRLRSEF